VTGSGLDCSSIDSIEGEFEPRPALSPTEGGHREMVMGVSAA